MLTERTHDPWLDDTPSLYSLTYPQTPRHKMAMRNLSPPPKDSPA